MSKRRGLLFFTLRVAISGLLLFWLGRKFGGSLAQLKGVEPAQLWIAVLLFAASTVLGALQWAMLLWHGGVRMRFAGLLRLYWIGMFCSNFLPSSVGGDVVKIADVAVSEGGVARTIAATVLDRLLGLLTLVILAFAWGAYLGGRNPAGIPWWLLAVAALPVLGTLALLLSRRLSQLLIRAIRALSKGARGQRITSLAEQFAAFRLAPGLLFRVLALSLLVQGLRISTHLAVARELGWPLDIQRVAEFFVVIPVLALAIVLPVSFNGLGLRELVATRIMPQIGIGAEAAVTLQLSTYLVQVAVSLVGGVLFAIELSRGRLFGRRRNSD